MWRSLFLAAGITMVLLGVQFLGVEKLVLHVKGDPPPPTSPWDNEPKVAAPVEVAPPPWAPWSLLSTGAITCLYSFTIPRRMNGG